MMPRKPLFFSEIQGLLLLARLTADRKFPPIWRVTQNKRETAMKICNCTLSRIRINNAMPQK